MWTAEYTIFEINFYILWVEHEQTHETRKIITIHESRMTQQLTRGWMDCPLFVPIKNRNRNRNRLRFTLEMSKQFILWHHNKSKVANVCNCNKLVIFPSKKIGIANKFLRWQSNNNVYLRETQQSSIGCVDCHLVGWLCRLKIFLATVAVHISQTSN